MNFWLVKQEPQEFSWTAFAREGQTAWTGVRNYQARNYLRVMKSGDFVLFYHSGSAKQIVGVACVTTEAYPDPTATEGDWSAVDLAPLLPLRQSMDLAALKADDDLKTMPLVCQSRLSVMPVTATQFRRIMALSQTPLASLPL